MSKSNSTEKHLENISFLLAALVLKREVSVKQVAKIMGVSDKTLTKMLPEKAGSKAKNVN